MSTADLVALVAFAACVLLGLFVLTVMQTLKQRPGSRVRTRLQETLYGSQDPARQRVLKDLERAQAEARRRRQRQALGGLGYHLNRLDAINGRKGVRVLVLTAVVTLLVLLVIRALGWLPEGFVLNTLAFVGGPIVIVIVAYRKMVERFRLRFLHQLPDAMDLIVRASQAGIPPTQAIRSVGERFDAPLGPEFRRMGDSLFLGNDLEDVLSDAASRIELPDFSFFSVCLLLQRETGGSLAEALENLSGIIRARRDLRLKTRALTAEGRLAGGILAVLPFLITGALILVNPEYVSVLFETEAGQRLLWVAVVMLVIGILLIRKISRMEV